MSGQLVAHFLVYICNNQYICTYICQAMGIGRNKELANSRDAELYRRYRYWTEEKMLRFDETLEILSKHEFFISETRILTIIRRMMQNGAEVPVRSRFSGFRGPRRRKSEQQDGQLCLFREDAPKL